jgi:hypothetical protein
MQYHIFIIGEIAPFLRAEIKNAGAFGSSVF